MKSWILALSVAVMAAGLAPLSVDAKRLGGGSSSGMQRSLPSRSTPDATPAKPAQATPTAPGTAGAAPAAAPKRSWMGPIAGLAAGLGIAALMSHLGMGAEFGNILMMLLLAGVAFVAIRFVMSRMGAKSSARPMQAPGGMQFAGAGAGAGSGAGSGWNAQPAIEPVLPSPPVQATFARPPTVPVGFDQAGFERIAKMIFIRMQAANDSADLNDLRQFTTPEMYAAVKLDLQERGSSTQHTDVVRVDADVLDFSDETERQVVSVRFHGLIKEEASGPTQPFDEVWHLVKPNDGSQWAIAGIQQTA
ncbi:MAG: TIM44-like domain-containing protein [Burkholderiaceae bacterium]|nr:TIM44-like domain-containing protein [Burkholderiaceae bacterium]